MCILISMLAPDYTMPRHWHMSWHKKEVHGKVCPEFMFFTLAPREQDERR